MDSSYRKDARLGSMCCLLTGKTMALLSEEACKARGDDREGARASKGACTMGGMIAERRRVCRREMRVCRFLRFRFFAL